MPVDSSSPAGTLPGYPSPEGASHPPSALLRALLAQAGTTLSTPMACGLGGGIGFLYTVFEYAAAPVPLLTVVAQHHPQPWPEAAAEHLGLDLLRVTSSRTGPALRKLDAVLTDGRAAHLLVGSGTLPWHEPVGAEAAADPCPVVVAGRDGDSYLVDDGRGPLHPVGPEELAVAWSTHRQGRLAVTSLPADHPVELDDQVLAAGVRAALATTHAHLTGPVLGLAFDTNFGLQGMHHLLQDLRDSRTRRGWARRFPAGDPLATGAARLAACLTTEHTAPGGTRLLYAQFLTEAQDLTGLELAEAREACAAAGVAWTHVADAARTVTAQDEATTALPALAELVARAVGHEEDLAEALGRALEDAAP